MRVCPNCGYRNADDAETCLRCDYQLVEPDEAPAPASRSRPAPPTPITLPRAASAIRRQKALWFLVGALLGLIPAAIYALGAFAYGLYGIYGNSFGSVAGPGWPTIGCYLLPVLFIITGIFLSVRKFRPLGYGLLAAALISPVVVGISCAVAPKV